jgi:hypothetical protein
MGSFWSFDDVVFGDSGPSLMEIQEFEGDGDEGDDDDDDDEGDDDEGDCPGEDCTDCAEQYRLFRITAKALCNYTL